MVLLRNQLLFVVTSNDLVAFETTELIPVAEPLQGKIENGLKVASLFYQQRT
jgi:hypothetical protein